MRKLASKMRDDVAEAEENKVAVRKDDKTIPAFTIEFPNLIGPIVQINSLSLMSPLTHDVVHVPFSLTVKKKRQRYILKGPQTVLVNQHSSSVSRAVKMKTQSSHQKSLLVTIVRTSMLSI